MINDNFIGVPPTKDKTRKNHVQMKPFLVHLIAKTHI